MRWHSSNRGRLRRNGPESISFDDRVDPWRQSQSRVGVFRDTPKRLAFTAAQAVGEHVEEHELAGVGFCGSDASLRSGARDQCFMGYRGNTGTGMVGDRENLGAALSACSSTILTSEASPDWLMPITRESRSLRLRR